MDLTRRDLIKSLSVLPFMGFLNKSEAPAVKQVDDYSNFGKMFNEINFDEWPNGIATYNIFNPDNFIKFSKPYEIDGNYYTSVKQGKHDYTNTVVPLSKDIKITDEECMRMVLCSAVDRNIVVFDSEASGYTGRLSNLMSETLYENHTLYSDNQYYRYVRFPFDESELIHFTDNMMDYATNVLGANLGSYNGKQFTRFCVGVKCKSYNWLDNGADLPFYKIKYKDYYGLVTLDNENLILGMY